MDKSNIRFSQVVVNSVENGFVIGFGGVRGDTYATTQVARSPEEMGALLREWGHTHFPPAEPVELAAPSSEPARAHFGWALRMLKAGRRVARVGWNGKGMWLHLQVPDAGSKMTHPYVYMRTADGHLVPWLASQTDILSDDWVLVEA